MADSRLIPEDFRKLLIPPGTRISPVSGEAGEPEWNYDNRPQGVLEKYLVAQNPFHLGRDNPKWDTVVIISRDNPIRVAGMLDKTLYSGNKQLLFHRSSIETGTPYTAHWDADDQTTIAFGIQPQVMFNEEPLSTDIWQPNCVLLEYFATVIVEDLENPSQLVQAILFTKERKALIVILEEGAITRQEFDRMLKKLEQKYSDL